MKIMQANLRSTVLASTLAGLALSCAPADRPATASLPDNDSAIPSSDQGAGAAQQSLPPGKPGQPPGPQVEDPPMQAPIYALSPGNDICLGGAWEPTIAVDPNDPDTVAASQGGTIWVSFDGGNSFTQTLNAAVPPNITLGGDPSIAFNSRGALFLTYLGSPSSPGRDVYMSGWTRIGNSFNFSFGPINVTAGAGQGAPNNADKEWLAIDWYDNSPFRDAIHVTWADLDQNPWQIWSTSSFDNGISWTPGAQLSINAEGPKPWGVRNTVAPNGDVYVAYHSQLGFLDPPNNRVPDGVSGQVIVHRSTDGGTSYTKTATNPFDPGEADVTWNVQHAANGVVPRNNSWWQGNADPPVLAHPTIAGRLYVVACDDPDDDVDSGDACDIMFSRSDDFGATWTAPKQVDDGPNGTFAIMPAAAIDPISGNLVVTWYDNRSLTVGTSGEWLLDLRASYSASAGTFWFPSIDINDGQFDPGLSTSCRFCCNPGDCPAGSPQTRRIGEYNGVAYGSCTAHMVWADNEVCGSGGSLLDVFYDNDPELGGDLTPPVIVCPPNTSVGCLESTHPQNTGYATATDNCDQELDLVWVDIPKEGNCPPSVVLSSIERIWSATDAAGNIATCSQNISIVDFDPPQILNMPLPLTVTTTTGCISSSDPQIQAWLAPITAVDDCSQATLNIILPDEFLGGCRDGLKHFITVAAGDQCNNGTFEIAELTVRVDPGAGIPYCFGDGSCPCGNAGLPGHGCNIAQDTGGVCLTGQNFNPDFNGGGTVDLLGVGFPLGTTPTVIAIRSENQQSVPFGDGKLCLLGPIKRLPTAAAQDGKVLIPIVHEAGDGRFNYQLWFRNPPAAFCNAQAAFNLSNALTLTWPK